MFRRLLSDLFIIIYVYFNPLCLMVTKIENVDVHEVCARVPGHHQPLTLPPEVVAVIAGQECGGLQVQGFGLQPCRPYRCH